MRRIRVIGMAGLLALLAGHAAEAANPGKLDTTADLLAFCEESSDAGDPTGADLAFCNGFIAGTGLFYLELVRADAIKPLACKEPTPPLNEIRSAFVRWAKANPQQLSSKPVDGFWQAMAATYPCSR